MKCTCNKVHVLLDNIVLHVPITCLTWSHYITCTVYVIYMFDFICTCSAACIQQVRYTCTWISEWGQWFAVRSLTWGHWGVHYRGRVEDWPVVGVAVHVQWVRGPGMRRLHSRVLMAFFWTLKNKISNHISCVTCYKHYQFMYDWKQIKMR